MRPECRQHPTAQPEGLSKDYSARYSRGMLSPSNYGPYKPCNPWHLSAGLVMPVAPSEHSNNSAYSIVFPPIFLSIKCVVTIANKRTKIVEHLRVVATLRHDIIGAS